ncbi:uncharacterized protein LOC124111183 [Haliotis rufescens]|uniref:uncharacterized protein LOC124111183 n=1 Tax=Haliotis rufescens TaxID=6454 RepID=UPI00201EB3B3|nr:uncharacterized protein LOC124111183 [Haliotis rufescens]
MLAAVVVILGVVGGAWGHGYVYDPPGRSTMWRWGFKVPINYNDNALNCGGFSNQWYAENGKCGVCGDPYEQPSPRDNEAGGKYGLGIIARGYKTGQDIPITIEITANHQGYFEFRLCKNDDVKKVVTQACLDQNLLHLKNANGTRYYLQSSQYGKLYLTASLPAGLTCSQCVLQWKWRAGNNEGRDSHSHECKGCGPQEEFFSCSDICIGDCGGSLTPAPVAVTTGGPQTPPPTLRPVTTTPPRVFTPRPTSRPIVVTQLPPVTAPNYGIFSTCHGVNNLAGLDQLDQWCKSNCQKGNCPTAVCDCPDAFGPRSTLGSRSTARPVVTPMATPKPTARPAGHIPAIFQSCHGVNLWFGFPDLDKWCIENCAKGNCPSVQCDCPGPWGHHTAAPATAQPAATAHPAATAKPTLFFMPSTKRTPAPTRAPTLRPPITPGQHPFLSVTPWVPPQATPSRPPATAGHLDYSRCHGINNWQGIPQLDAWCRLSCRDKYCPEVYCRCY